MNRWDWHGAVATILALAVGVGFAVAMVGATVQHEPITQQGAALLNTLGGALIGAVAGWLGGAAVERSNTRGHHEMTTTTPPDPDELPQVNDPTTDPDDTTPQDVPVPDDTDPVDPDPA